MLQAIGAMYGVVCLAFAVVKPGIQTGPVSHLLAVCVDAFQYRVGLGLNRERLTGGLLKSVAEVGGGL